MAKLLTLHGTAIVTSQEDDVKFEEIIESPRIVGPVDWNLGNRTANRARAQEVLGYPHVVLKSVPGGKLIASERPHGGHVSLVTDVKAVDYEMRYDVGARPDLGRCATQVRVWRSRTSLLSGLAKLVFTDHLLNKFDSVVSDHEQTRDGKDFWISRLADSQMSRTIGVIRSNNTLDLFPKGGDIHDWIAQTGAWGRESRFRGTLFFISNRAADVILADQATGDAHRSL